MHAVVALLALVAVVVAQNPPTPQISEDFYAEVSLEEHYGDRTLFGQGRWAIDTTANQAVEDYEFEDSYHNKFYVFNLARYDLGKDYTINSFNRTDCNVTALTGNMPATWGWVSASTYSGKFYYRNYYLDTFTYNFAGVNLVVGVQAPYFDTPVIFIQNTTDYAIFITFERFYASQNFNATYFQVPAECQATAAPKATPTRPNPAEIFSGNTRVEIFANGTLTYGEGYIASNQPAGQYLEQYDFQPAQSHSETHFFELLRYDLGESYYISSQNYSDCNAQAVSGSLAPFWAWLAQANYVGQRYVHSYGLLDIWNFIAGGVNVTLAVDDRDVNTPLFLARETSNYGVRYDFVRWNPYAPDQSDFDVPKECQQ